MGKGWMKQQPKFKILFLLYIYIVVFFSTITATTCSATATPRIILLETFDIPVVLEHTKFFLESMAKLGYEKETIQILKAQGDSKKAELLLQEAISGPKKPDIIVANATIAAKAAHAVSKTEKIPMVFFVVSDPVGAGIVAELNVPSKELVSGIVHGVPRETKVEIIMRILKPVKPKGRPVRFGYIHSDYPSAIGDLKMLKEAAQKSSDLEFVSYQIPYHEKHFDIQETMHQLIQGIEKLDSQIDYWWISQDPVAELEEFVQTLAKKSTHPIVCGTNSDSIKDGALVYIMADSETGARETATIVDSVLKGTAVGEIPVHPPSKIDFGINLSTAQRMGVAIPSDLIVLAGPNIYK